MKLAVSGLQVSPPVKQLPWTYRPITLRQAKPPETRDFHMLAAIRNCWTKRELERQLQSGGIPQRDVAARQVSPTVGRIRPTALDELKNAYRVALSRVVTRRSEQQA